MGAAGIKFLYGRKEERGSPVATISQIRKDKQAHRPHIECESKLAKSYGRAILNLTIGFVLFKLRDKSRAQGNPNL